MSSSPLYTAVQYAFWSFIIVSLAGILMRAFVFRRDADDARESCTKHDELEMHLGPWTTYTAPFGPSASSGAYPCVAKMCRRCKHVTLVVDTTVQPVEKGCNS